MPKLLYIDGKGFAVESVEISHKRLQEGFSIPLREAQADLKLATIEETAAAITDQFKEKTTLEEKNQLFNQLLKVFMEFSEKAENKADHDYLARLQAAIVDCFVQNIINELKKNPTNKEYLEDKKQEELLDVLKSLHWRDALRLAHSKINSVDVAAIFSLFPQDANKRKEQFENALKAYCSHLACNLQTLPCWELASPIPDVISFKVPSSEEKANGASSASDIASPAANSSSSDSVTEIASAIIEGFKKSSVKFEELPIMEEQLVLLDTYIQIGYLTKEESQQFSRLQSEMARIGKTTHWRDALIKAHLKVNLNKTENTFSFEFIPSETDDKYQISVDQAVNAMLQRVRTLSPEQKVKFIIDFSNLFAERSKKGLLTQADKDYYSHLKKALSQYGKTLHGARSPNWREVLLGVAAASDLEINHKKTLRRFDPDVNAAENQVATVFDPTKNPKRFTLFHGLLGRSFAISASTFLTNDEQKIAGLRERHKQENSFSLDAFHSAYTLSKSGMMHGMVFALSDGCGHSMNPAENFAAVELAKFLVREATRIMTAFVKAGDLTGNGSKDILESLQKAAKDKLKLLLPKICEKLHGGKKVSGTEMAEITAEAKKIIARTNATLCCGRAFLQEDGRYQVVGFNVGDSLLAAFNLNTGEIETIVPGAQKIDKETGQHIPLALPHHFDSKGKADFKDFDVTLPPCSLLHPMTNQVYSYLEMQSELREIDKDDTCKVKFLYFPKGLKATLSAGKTLFTTTPEEQVKNLGKNALQKYKDLVKDERIVANGVRQLSQAHDRVLQRRMASLREDIKADVISANMRNVNIGGDFTLTGMQLPYRIPAPYLKAWVKEGFEKYKSGYNLPGQPESKDKKKPGKGYRRYKLYSGYFDLFTKEGNKKDDYFPRQLLILYACLSNKDGPTLQGDILNAILLRLKTSSKIDYFGQIGLVEFKKYLIDYLSMYLSALLQRNGHSLATLDTEVVEKINKDANTKTDSEIEKILSEVKEALDDGSKFKKEFRRFLQLIGPPCNADSIDKNIEDAEKKKVQHNSTSHGPKK